MYVAVLFLKTMKSGFLKMLYELVLHMHKNIRIILSNIICLL